jgi:hypothetical protein
MTKVYEVAGGWQAEDPELFIACFGQTEDEAKASLEKARLRADEIERRSDARIKTSQGMVK